MPSSTEGNHGEPQAKRPRMHDGVTWCDDPICCCEAEPRWQQVADQLAEDKGPGPGADDTAPPRRF
jgi:hypothetical protein